MLLFDEKLVANVPNSHKRCISADMAYLTGYQDRHYDAPTPSGFIALQMNHRPKRSPHYIVPISIVCSLSPLPN